MDLPLPEWMEFVVVGVSVVLLPFVLRIIDRFQKPSDD
jgi:hypothetical protein